VRSRIPRRHSECEEVAIQILETRAVLASSEERGRTEQLPCASNFGKAIRLERILESQVELLDER